MVGLYGPHDDPLTLHHIFEPGGEGGGGGREGSNGMGLEHTTQELVCQLIS